MSTKNEVCAFWQKGGSMGTLYEEIEVIDFKIKLLNDIASRSSNHEGFSKLIKALEYKKESLVVNKNERG